MKKKIEILAPAKNLVQGIAAINAGADAVYIGAPLFGARTNATNSIEDIAEMVTYAHLFKAQVFVVINTILYENELEPCRQLIHQLYTIGVDALIVQDMSIMEMDIPPIVIHASTQANNRDPKHVKFLKDAGMQRVVLARELNLDQIREISQATNVELEFFVSGALCVSFSGNCYMSIAGGERSANRGSCAQNCRLPYNLTDGTGKTLIENSHLLSIKDLDLSDQLPNLIEAGVTSFKIEGRLKDMVYVKNNTSYLRKKLDAFLENNDTFQKASSGRTFYNFEAEMDRSFNRGYTDYFVNKRKEKIGNWESPKSQGQVIGKLIEIKANGYVIENYEKLNNGDGLYFINEQGEADGTQVNIIINNIVVPNTLKPLAIGTMIYRNSDAEFNKMVEKENSVVRKIGVTLQFTETLEGFQLLAIDEDGHQSIATLTIEKEVAKNETSTVPNIKTNLAKTGNTPFIIDDIQVNFSNNWFLPISKVNEVRREVLEQLIDIRVNEYHREEFQITKTDHPYPVEKLDFTYNVSNHLAKAFYKRHGVTEIEKAFELQWDPGKARVMTTKYCVKYELGKCARFQRETMGEKVVEPLTLTHGENAYKLKFNCKPCEMEIWEKDADLEFEDEDEQLGYVAQKR
ncbi:U32 family peptidase [Flavobacterium psychrophilum]|uniref:peptidase U32 family protein n=1 Tax=Flavobacterium psychrophilum TaxID=96345 RepID=UPI0004F71BE6|nr:U32 family peptidase [Flavobacterium psychrophilum]AIN74752.1 peptidase U32 [Flavobacterium psychrophilum FPG3]EKT2069878.1 U32 family peptidase [Flavobacterium psychrophilum]EKT2072314.1 U32 family peptidase [Flavobacterium psychrophilum]EKT4491743.1 U32 family peptidase [Flavobacterium psychrophilum]EKT4498352.1 U32 family peptidase [Flavobacterium psychrophilum]